MLQTVEAEIDESGEVRLLEAVRVTKKARAVVTILENENDAKRILEFLRSPEFANRKSYSAEEIKAQIEEARKSWG